jgi:ribosomal protein S18 acetylase RimI-like enzyme
MHQQKKVFEAVSTPESLDQWWTKHSYAEQKEGGGYELCFGLRFIRMDTWADNPAIIDNYKSFGFDVAGYFKTPDIDELPIQRQNNEIVLLEMKLQS